jgi:2-dehydro-3-deoxy-D-pentonate aldolase
MTSIAKLPRPFRGIITPLVTPLINDESLDEKGLNLLLNHIIEGGVNGAFILGTTGECASLSYKLKHKLIALTCELAKGRIPVFVGITDSSPAESLSLAKVAEETGASAVVAAPPYYFDLGQQELITYFMNLADKLPLPLFVYNIPSQTKIMIQPETVKILASHHKIVGMKDSSGSATYFNSLLYHMKDDPSFTLLVGPDEMMASAVLMGGHGGVNAGSNFYPRLFVDLYKSAIKGNLKEVLQFQEKVMEFSAKTYQVGTTGTTFLKGLKAAMSISGFFENYTASPLTPFGEREMEIIKENLKHLNRK